MADSDRQSQSREGGEDHLIYLGYIEQGDAIDNELGTDYRDPGPRPTTSLKSDDGPDNTDPPWLINKLGGLPIFPFISDEELAKLESILETITCRACKRPCMLVFQIKGSIDESELDRVVQVYACVDQKCSKHTWIALRCLFPDHAEKKPELVPKFLRAVHDETLGTVLVDDSRMFFKPHYVSVMEEPTGRENFASNNLEALKLASKFTDLDLNPAPIEAKYKNLKNYQAPKPPAHLSDLDDFEKFQLENLYANDKTTYRFYKRLRRYQGQVVRYDWQGEPLLSSDKFKYRPTACQSCQSRRYFEFQLMPALMNYFSPANGEIKNEFDRETIDFSSVVISSCSKNCSDTSKFSLEETMYLPDPDSRSYNKAQQRLSTKLNGPSPKIENEQRDKLESIADESSGESKPSAQSKSSKRRNRRKKK